MDGAEEAGALRPATIEVSSEALDRARFGFHRAFPRLSAKRVLFVTQGVGLGLIGWGVAAALDRDAALTLRIMFLAAYLVFAACIIWRLLAAANLTPLLSRIGEPRGGVWPTYTLLCPVYREANVVVDLIAALDRLDYPGME